MITDFTFSHHALSRALDMNLGADELRQCLESPTVVADYSARGDKCKSYFGERITCVVSEAGVVVTVVWRTAESWQQDIETCGYGGRRFNQEEWI